MAVCVCVCLVGFSCAHVIRTHDSREFAPSASPTTPLFCQRCGARFVEHNPNSQRARARRVCSPTLYPSKCIKMRRKHTHFAEPHRMDICGMVSYTHTHTHARCTRCVYTFRHLAVLYSSCCPAYRTTAPNETVCAVRTYRPQNDGDLNALCTRFTCTRTHTHTRCRRRRRRRSRRRRRRRLQSNGKADIGVLSAFV